MFRWLHPDWGSALANRSSHASRSYQARDGGAGLRQSAAGRPAKEPALELLIYGHSHVPELTHVGHGRAVYANAGPWLDQQTFLRVTEDRIELRKWDEGLSAEGVNLHTLDRVAEKALP